MKYIDEDNTLFDYSVVVKFMPLPQLDATPGSYIDRIKQIKKELNSYESDGKYSMFFSGWTIKIVFTKEKDAAWFGLKFAS